MRVVWYFRTASLTTREPPAPHHPPHPTACPSRPSPSSLSPFPLSARGPSTSAAAFPAVQDKGHCWRQMTVGFDYKLNFRLEHVSLWSFLTPSATLLLAAALSSNAGAASTSHKMIFWTSYLSQSHHLLRTVVVTALHTTCIYKSNLSIFHLIWIVSKFPPSRHSKMPTCCAILLPPLMLFLMAAYNLYVVSAYLHMICWQYPLLIHSSRAFWWIG